MTRQPPTSDLKKIWLSQNPEYPTMSLQEIRDKVRKLHETRRNVSWLCLVFFVVVLVFYFQLLLRYIARVEMFGWWISVFSVLILIYLAYLSCKLIMAKRLGPEDDL